MSFHSTSLHTVPFPWRVCIKHWQPENEEDRPALSLKGEMDGKSWRQHNLWVLESDSLGGIPDPAFTVWPGANFWTSLCLSCFTGKGRDMILVLPYVLLLQGSSDLIHVKCLGESLAWGKYYHETIRRQGEKYSNRDKSKAWRREWRFLSRAEGVRDGILGFSLRDGRGRVGGTITATKKTTTIYWVLAVCRPCASVLDNELSHLILPIAIPWNWHHITIIGQMRK